MKPKKISTIFLDIGGILLTNGWGHEERQHAIEKFRLDKKETESRNSLIWSTYELDKLKLDDYLNYVIFYKNRNFTKQQFSNFMYEQAKPLDGALEYFKQLKKHLGCKVVALSNEARDLNTHRIEKFKLNELFDFYISSCYVGLRKPDPAIYKMALDISQTKTNRCVYIDDRLPYIEAATNLAIPSLHYKNLDSAKEYFKNI